MSSGLSTLYTKPLNTQSVNVHMFIIFLPQIVAEDLTITGSIGVVSTKLSLKEIYDKIGFSRENISKGRYAEFDVDNRPFTQDEAAYFEHGAQLAYKSFVSKAAESRGKDYDSMHALAQGRVWTGRQGM